jgi:putative endonuclease
MTAWAPARLPVDISASIRAIAALSAGAAVGKAVAVATDRQRRGLAAEQRAVNRLCEAGFRIVLRNFRCRAGELDIVACRSTLLVIAEVRLRTRSDYGGAGASITRRKRLRIVTTARYLLYRRPALASLTIRFDTLLFDGPEGALEWIEDAFRA